MRIISPFKDYYDHIAYIYGGGDPKIVYERRKRIADEDLQLLTDTTFNGVHSPSLWLNPVSPVKSKGTLCVAGRTFCLMHDTETGEVFVHNPKKRDEYVRYVGYRWATMNEERRKQEEPNLTYVDNGAIMLSRMAKAPVFLIKDVIYGEGKQFHAKTYVIDKETPILSTIGMAALYPPEQIYQDLAYYISNLMNESPDMMPPTVQQKIESHGFDLKQSFRHRKEEDG